jgi:5-methylcytosine-specific restriction protein B
MIEKITEIIEQYKIQFEKIDAEERYKWIAVKHFQDKWDIDSLDFALMLEQSFSKHINLLDSGVARPLAVLVSFAKHEPENVRTLFKTLYDESLPIDERSSAFVEGVDLFVSKMRQEDASWKSTFQDQHAISVYLAFRYPEDYYIYKYSILKAVAPLFGKESKGARMATYREICDAIHDVAESDDKLITMSHARLGDNCYQDPENRLLAMDIALFIYKKQLQKIEAEKLLAKPIIVSEFKKWLEMPTRNNGKPYDYKTVKVYIQQIENEMKKLVPPYEGNINLFTYSTKSDYDSVFTTLTDIISSVDNQVNGAFQKVLKLYGQFLSEREQLPPNVPPFIYPPVDPPLRQNTYNREKFLEEVFLTAEDYDTLINLLIRKKNLILQGAPGVGKTFAAKRLVYSLIGEKTSDRICFIQFHQSYWYEDFVMGYRPNYTGFELKDGSFYSFCKEAAKDPENDWFFIIDEINRGNISKIFGELLMLVESDKRGKHYAIRLQGTDEPFFVPENVYIIGMMNTADRSIALIDYALRRRFAFYSLEPAFENESFLDYIESKNYDNFGKVIEVVSKLNDEIESDPLLGAGFKIGHSYFCTDDMIEMKLLRDIILYEIKPLLSEYWVDDANKVSEWTSKLLGAVQ